MGLWAMAVFQAQKLRSTQPQTFLACSFLTHLFIQVLAEDVCLVEQRNAAFPPAKAKQNLSRTSLCHTQK